MRIFATVAALAGCAASGPTTVPPTRAPVPIALAWRVAPRDAGLVDVTLDVGNREVVLPPISGATAPTDGVYVPDPGPGDPSTCEIRNADARSCELACGRGLYFNYYIAELHPNGELVLAIVTGSVVPWTVSRKDVIHVAVDGDVLETAPLR
jgi:hypothetical protein